MLYIVYIRTGSATVRMSDILQSNNDNIRPVSRGSLRNLLTIFGVKITNTEKQTRKFFSKCVLVK